MSETKGKKGLFKRFLNNIAHYKWFNITFFFKKKLFLFPKRVNICTFERNTNLILIR